MNAQRLNQERLMQVILAPQVSEKSTYVAEKHEQVVFRVISSATKPEIKAAVELMFKVQVDAVQVANVKGKSKCPHLYRIPYYHTRVCLFSTGKIPSSRARDYFCRNF